jgi:hypothetical protein
MKQTVHCMTYLFSCLYVGFEAHGDDPCLWVEHALGVVLYKIVTTRKILSLV